MTLYLWPGTFSMRDSLCIHSVNIRVYSYLSGSKSTHSGAKARNACTDADSGAAPGARGCRSCTCHSHSTPTAPTTLLCRLALAPTAHAYTLAFPDTVRNSLSISIQRMCKWYIVTRPVCALHGMIALLCNDSSTMPRVWPFFCTFSWHHEACCGSPEDHVQYGTTGFHNGSHVQRPL